MNAGTSDASTSTEDIAKGRPLCLFYFAHPFGVLSCEPPAVLAPAPAPAPAPAHAPAPAPAPEMQRGAPCRPGRFARTLPPLQLPSPRDCDADFARECAEDAWQRSWLVPERAALPPIELPPPPGATPAPVRARRSPRPSALAGVRKGRTRSRGPLARLLRRAVATGVGVSAQVTCGARAAWQPRSPSPSLSPSPGIGAGARKQNSQRASTATSRLSSAPASASPAPPIGAYGMAPLPAPPPLRRRYSLPETVMRRYRIAREQSEYDEVSVPSSGYGACGSCGRQESTRDAVRRAALLRRAQGCRCARALGPLGPLGPFGGSLAEVCASPPPVLLPPPPPPPRLVEVCVSQTLQASPPSPPGPLYPQRSSRLQLHPIDSNVDIDEYVSNILVDSLNSLSDRLDNMTVSIGGEGSISVVEKEIKVKLRNKGVNTVVHLSPTSNNQIIFGNKELCERVPSGARPAEARASSPAASLVDSLDDPLSPRAPPQPPPPLPPPPPPPPLTLPMPSQLLASPRLSASPLSHLQDSNSMTPKEKCESFFIRMNEDNCACEKENIVVADHMPEKIKQRLHRRHRRRELRARRGGVRRVAREGQRQCAALVDALIDDAIARVARDELRCARIARAADVRPKVETGKSDLRPRIETGKPNGCIKVETRNARHGSKVEPARPQERPARRSPPRAPPTPHAAPAPHDVGPRRLYHKSEIHDGGKCIEILEIVEYAQSSRSSSETNSDESSAASRARRSRIPVPIPERHEAARGRRAGAPAAGGAGPAPPERATPGAVRFERVFEVIPEEKSSLSVESASEAPAPPALAPLPARRSAATSPPPPSTLHPARGEESPDCPASRPGGRAERRARRSVGTQWAATVRGGSSSEGEPRRSRPAALRPRPRERATPAPPTAAAAPAAAPTNTDGWSLTLAGSCRAALPSRLDLRLRFPSRGTAPRATTHSPRSDAPTDCSDAKSQDTEWAGAGGTRARDRLPALRTRAASRAQGGCCGRCRCGSPAPGGARAGGEGRRRREPYHAAELKTLAVLGSAIVPERRAAPPARRRPPAATPTANLPPRARAMSFTGFF